jgi:pyruvate-ferredoxin/flavodoxin oxidoreductase
MNGERVCLDGNEAVARVAHRLSEVIAIYPITPASTMGELADTWTAEGKTNLWGTIPDVIEMQSEAGAAGALHGAAQKGALATTFTASQGLLLMIPDLYKIAGELTPAVVHVAARTVATHALSIFGDHSDVMAARATGWAMLASASVQEAHDFALVAHTSTLASRVPFLHFFDGFRTSHEVARITPLSEDDLRALVDEHLVLEHRGRGLSPDHPVLRGSSQNPDVFFQAREASNPYYLRVPEVVRAKMRALSARTGRPYDLAEYVGAPDADRVVVLMGSAAGAAEEAVEELRRRGERVGLLKVRLFRPFPSEMVASLIPGSTRSVAVLDRTKEPGAAAEPLFLDVLAALVEGGQDRLPRLSGGRYGLASKELTPAMIAGVFEMLRREQPPRRFTVGIVDDVTKLSIPYPRDFATDAAPVRALFYGLGSDGTVSATRSAVKIIAENTPLFAQGYFVYDSRKSGTLTVSHVRVAPEPIHSTYLVEDAGFVACHQFGLLDHVDVLKHARIGGTFLLNSAYGSDDVWRHLPEEIQHTVLDRQLSLWVIDADRIAREVGLGDRINTVMLPCFFVLAGVLPVEEALAHLKKAAAATYKKHGESAVHSNLAAIDRAVAGLMRATVPTGSGECSGVHRRPPVPKDAPDFVQRVTARMLAGDGDLLPVSALPADGTFPTGTSRWEKRAAADTLPVWDPSLCIDCGKCAIVCPHAAIRMKAYPEAALDGTPTGFLHKVFKSRELPGHQLTIQVAPDDCTGCGVCVEVCPGVSKSDPSHRSLAMRPAPVDRDRERACFEFFLRIPDLPPSALPADAVKTAQLRRPLFEFSGACAGCGETPYLKLLTQLFGDRIVVANATGCSSIFGGNLPTTPWAQNELGRGPAWSNSLFEDNAEFGLGMRLALERHVDEARRLLGCLAHDIGVDLEREILGDTRQDDAGIELQRARVALLKERLAALGARSDARRLASIADDLVRKSVWIVGGDGWAYDIGFGGLDHVLASGRNVNVLVLDTEVYSNTGGQASKATPRGAVARFAAGGKTTAKKDLGRIAMTYEGVYVAQVALGADDKHTIRALLEADAWPGPSLVIAYSTCIAHGIEMCHSMTHQRDAVRSGYWPLYRFTPGDPPSFHLDTRRRNLSVDEFEASEERFRAVARTDADGHLHLRELAKHDVDARWEDYARRTTEGHASEPHGK